MKCRNISEQNFVRKNDKILLSVVCAETLIELMIMGSRKWKTDDSVSGRDGFHFFQISKSWLWRLEANTLSAHSGISVFLPIHSDENLLPCLSAINCLLVHFWKCFFGQLFCWQCCLAFSWPCWHKGCWVSGIGYSACSFTETITMWWREHRRYWWNWLYLEKKKTWLASNIRDNKMDFLNEVSGESQQETECCFRLLTKCFWSEKVRTFIFVNLFSMSQSCKKQFK